ncbi:MAG: glycosyltransferase [Gammaproteobacteria bacterium]|jgi:glycosyltransferase involved in cell wall biosynthesis|nr:glycosyltransferase [Gammaproteobacteria bacterium]
MHIVNLISGKDLGGPKQAFVHYSDNLRHLGHQVTSIIRPGAQVQQLLVERQLDYRLLNYPRSRLPGCKHVAQHRLQQLFTSTQPDLLMVHKPIDAALARPALPAGCKLVLVLHSYTAKGLAAADMILAVSEPVREFVRQQGFDGPVMVMPNLVELNPDEPVTRIKQKPMHIAHMGIMRRTKGQDLLIHALQLLQATEPAFRATLAGKGRWFRKINKLIKQTKLDSKVITQGWVNNAQRDAFFDHADVICVPSRSETFGMLVIEAMARKKLVLATRCGGPEGIIEHGQTGFLAAINAQSLATELAHIMQLSDTEYQAICERAYQHVVDHYSSHPFRQRLRKMLATLTGSN